VSGLFYFEVEMALTDQIAADQQAVADAQAALEAAQAKLAQDQAALDALQPHLSMWQEVEATAKKYGGEIESEFTALAARARQMLGV
jgi:hypothetical protein